MYTLLMIFFPIFSITWNSNLDLATLPKTTLNDATVSGGQCDLEVGEGLNVGFFFEEVLADH